MKKEKYIYGLFLLSLPMSCYASGQNVLTLIGLELILTITFIIFLITININIKGKGFLIFIFILTHLIFYKFTENLPYTKNQLFINTLSFVLPVLTVLTTYLIIRKKNIN